MYQPLADFEMSSEMGCLDLALGFCNCSRLNSAIGNRTCDVIPPSSDVITLHCQNAPVSCWTRTNSYAQVPYWFSQDSSKFNNVNHAQGIEWSYKSKVTHVKIACTLDCGAMERHEKD